MLKKIKNLFKKKTDVQKLSDKYRKFLNRQGDVPVELDLSSAVTAVYNSAVAFKLASPKSPYYDIDITLGPDLPEKTQLLVRAVVPIQNNDKDFETLVLTKNAMLRAASKHCILWNYSYTFDRPGNQPIFRSYEEYDNSYELRMTLKRRQ